MKELGLTKMVCIIFVFCAATAIASPAQILTTLHNFAGPPSDGADPYAGLVQASDGNFYGTTGYGGAGGNCGYGCGTLFKMTPSGALTTLYSFCSQTNCTDGSAPAAGLVQASDGNFYGTTVNGGANNLGTVFKITPGGTLTTLHSFCSPSNCSDGAHPSAGLVQASDGNLYGTVEYGGANNYGTVFKIAPGGELTTMYSFCSQTNCLDGVNPAAGLVQASDGNFYGTTVYGGGDNQGTVFKITPSGTLTTLHSFGSQPNDGANPSAGLVQATDGNFYGTTVSGGAFTYWGTVFKMTPDGALTILYSFTGGNDGATPFAGLVQAGDGNFYGTTERRGAGNWGTVFKITPSGTLTTLHRFDGADGANTFAGLVQASDGNFYGTTSAAGANNDGTVFRLVSVRPCIICPATE